MADPNGSDPVTDLTHSPELAAAANSVKVTVGLLQESGDDEAQRAAAADLLQLSTQLRRRFLAAEGPIDEQEIIFWQELHWTANAPIHHAQLSARQLAHFSDSHLHMIRDVGTRIVGRIRYALEKAQIRQDVNIEHGILTAPLRGIKAAPGYLYCPSGMEELTLGDLRRMDEAYVDRSYGPQGRDKTYVLKLLKKVKAFS